MKPETLTRVREAMTCLKYQPNHLAVGLRMQRSDNIVVAVESIRNPFTSAFVEGISNVARMHGKQVLLAITGGDRAILNRHAAMIAGKRADGMIILSRNVTGLQTRRPEDDAALPIVIACEYSHDTDTPRVRIDNHEGAALAVGHLAGMGHRDIAAIAGPLDQTMCRDRLEGYKLGLARSKLIFDPILVAEGDFSLESGFDAMNRLLDVGTRITAVTCANDEMALGAINALQARGIAVPQQMSVMGFDNLRFGAFSTPPLTTIHIPVQELGETSMRLVLDVLLQPDAADAAREVILPHRLVVRGSTDSPPLHDLG